MEAWLTGRWLFSKTRMKIRRCVCVAIGATVLVSLIVGCVSSEQSVSRSAEPEFLQTHAIPDSLTLHIRSSPAGLRGTTYIPIGYVSVSIPYTLGVDGYASECAQMTFDLAFGRVDLISDLGLTADSRTVASPTDWTLELWCAASAQPKQVRVKARLRRTDGEVFDEILLEEPIPGWSRSESNMRAGFRSIMRHLAEQVLEKIRATKEINES